MKKIALFLYQGTVSHLKATVPQSDELFVLHQLSTAEMGTGSETKILSGQCMDMMTGLGTSASPYIVTRSTLGKTKVTSELVCKQLYNTVCAMDSDMYWLDLDGGSTDKTIDEHNMTQWQRVRSGRIQYG